MNWNVMRGPRGVERMCAWAWARVAGEPGEEC